jgi:hypothetical protein
MVVGAGKVDATGAGAVPATDEDPGDEFEAAGDEAALG